MAKQVMPEAELRPRELDMPLSDEMLLQISLFAELSKKPSLSRFPGAWIVRRYRKGEVICQQGEGGWTAFYILTTEDVLTLRQHQIPPAWRGHELKDWQEEVDGLYQRVEELRMPGCDPLERCAATAHLTVGRSIRKQSSWLRRLGGWLSPGSTPSDTEHPLSIIIDGTTDIDYKSLQAPLCEGELFGEMSCLYGTPRSATVVAHRDCYVLEMLRNILDQLQKDPNYKTRMDDIYKERVLQMHLRRLSIFSDLTEEQFLKVRDRVELCCFEPGQVIFDEHERSDSMYVIRSGLVKVMKRESALLHEQNIRDWNGLRDALRGGEQEQAGPRGKVWQLLPASIQNVLRASGDLSAVEKTDVLPALNGVITNPQFADAKELSSVVARVVASLAASDRAAEFPAKRKDFTEQERRCFHRLLLEEMYGKLIRTFKRRSGPECVLSYLSRGDFLGEMGLVTGLPRSATCIAYGHPRDEGRSKESTRVDLVRVPESVFREMLEASAAIRRKVERVVAERARQTQERTRTFAWDQSSQVLLSEHAEKLGLIQGQRLMLVDLDRCTRCDECVRACVSTHDDGHSRLFLDGPRFDKYLVPTSCRSCLDPVCMIGCPVGSIHRGDNGQMIIEDWCIGCGLCAKQCPYGAIQMHDIGIVAENARGWRFTLADAVTSKRWYRPREVDGRWPSGQGPFQFDREFRTRLAEQLGLDPETLPGKPLYFRYAFNLASYLLAPDSQFKLEVVSTDAALTLWLNGEELAPDHQTGKKREYWFPRRQSPARATPAHADPQFKKTKKVQALWKDTRKVAPERPAAAIPKPQPTQISLRSGRNLLAVKVTPPDDQGAIFFQLRLDGVNRASVPSEMMEEVTEKLVTERAVVCDLCSSLPGQVPACVNACPHDAAMRIDARFEFPDR